VGGQVIAVGGEGTTSVSNAVQAYDVKSQTWSQLTPLPTGRHGVAVTALKNSLYAIGGATTAGHVQSTAEADALDFD
jgi:N-acetylneuraminic acid mutarotase